MPSLYHYLYTGISRVKEFNSIIINNINKKDFFIDTNRFKATKNIIFTDSINKRIIRITLDQTIIIDLVIPKLKIIIKREEIKLLNLLQRLKTSTISKRNKRFLKKAKETRKVKEMGQ